MMGTKLQMGSFSVNTAIINVLSL